MNDRITDLIKFYELMDELRQRIGGYHKLSEPHIHKILPKSGVYFFMEDGEVRSQTGVGNRIVRIGTHGLIIGSKSSLASRLFQHRGNKKSLSGNHRGSIFRLLVGASFVEDYKSHLTWGQGSSATKDVRDSEQHLENKVSLHLRRMPFLYLDVGDAPSPSSIRGLIERNSIALLSNYQKTVIDPASNNWLGKKCNREKVQYSGLWNQRHVDEQYDPIFLSVLESLIKQTN
jgi:hypothetical protein